MRRLNFGGSGGTTARVAHHVPGSVPLPKGHRRGRGKRWRAAISNRAAVLTLLGVVLAILGAILGALLCAPMGPWSPFTWLDAPAESPEAVSQRQELESLQNTVRQTRPWLTHQHQVPQVLTQLVRGWPEGWGLSSLQVQPNEVRVKVQSLRPHSLAGWVNAPEGHRDGKASMLGAPEVVELQGSEATVETALRFSWRSSDVHDVSPSASAAGSLRRLQDLRQEAASKAEVFGADVGMPALVADLQSGLEHLGISVKSIKPGAVDIQGPWARCPIVVRGSGSLESMFKFLVVASRRAGVISLTPLALVRDPTPAALHGLAVPPLWTLELTVTRAWKVGKAASRTDSGWRVDDALDAPVLDGLRPFHTGPVPGRDQAFESPRLIPTPQIRRSEVGGPSRLDHELRDLREASAKAELAWV